VERHCVTVGRDRLPGSGSVPVESMSSCRRPRTGSRRSLWGRRPGGSHRWFRSRKPTPYLRPVPPVSVTVPIGTPTPLRFGWNVRKVGWGSVGGYHTGGFNTKHIQQYPRQSLSNYISSIVVILLDFSSIFIASTVIPVRSRPTTHTPTRGSTRNEGVGEGIHPHFDRHDRPREPRVGPRTNDLTPTRRISWSTPIVLPSGKQTVPTPMRRTRTSAEVVR